VKFETYLIIGTRNLLQARRRTVLLATAIIAVTALFIVLRSGAKSVSDRMIETATTLSSGHVNVGGFYKVRRKGADAIVNDRRHMKEIVAEIVPEATTIIDRGRGWGRIVSQESSINVGLIGINYEEETTLFSSLKLAAENEYKKGGSDQVTGNFADLAKPGQILIFAAQAKKLGVGINDSLTIVIEASGTKTNTIDVNIAAIASDMGFSSNWSTFISRQAILDLYRLDENTTGAIQIYLKDSGDANRVMGRLKEGLTLRGYQIMDHDPKAFFMKFDKVLGEDWLGQKLDLTIWSDEISYLTWITTAFDVLSYAILAILAGIISGGIANSMWMAVRERTKEIGTIRAIGLQKGQVAWLFLLEAFLLGWIASLVGCAFGAVAVGVVNLLRIPITDQAARAFLMTNELHFSLEPSLIVNTSILFALVAAAASIAPSFRASRLRPVEALMR
jgi:putative ABC transport system permease protein